jgi:hypothetical protein
MLFASASPTLTASSLTNLYLNVNGIIYLWFHPNLRYAFDPTWFRPPKPQLVFARLSISLTIWSCSLYSAPSRCSSQFIITSTTFSVLLILELLWKLHWWVIAVVMLLVMYPDWAMGIKLGQFCHLDGIALNLLYLQSRHGENLIGWYDLGYLFWHFYFVSDTLHRCEFSHL